MSEESKKLVKAIREATDSDTIELAKWSPSQVQELVQQAFSEPIRVPKMVRFTFVVGGGKKVRTKFYEDLPKDLCQALTAAGFTEDRGASCVLECAGCFKYQHDTDKDLKFVHVFPRVEIVAPAASAAAAADEDDDGDASSRAPRDEQCRVASLPQFERIVSKKVRSFAQKRALLKILREAEASVASMEARMARLELLSEAEQTVYDTVQALPEKIKWLYEQMEAMTAGELTAAERDVVSEQYSNRIEELEGQEAALRAEGKTAKADKCAAAAEAVKAKRTALAAITPVVPKVKFARELQLINAKLAAIAKLEASTQPAARSIEQMKQINERSTLEQQVEDIYEANRGWFEDEATFEARMKSAAKAAKAPAAKAPAAVGGAGGFTAARGGGARPAAGGARGGGASNMFAALGDA